MIIRFNKNLTKQNFYANGEELASVMGLDKNEKGQRVYDYPTTKEIYVTTINNPVLVTDHFKIAEMDPVTRDTIFKLFESSIKITKFDGVSLDFEQKKYLGVWGPSIDTLLFCRALNKANLAGIETSIEIGAGSGFISKYLLTKKSEIKNAFLVDLNPYSISCCKDNIQDKRANFFAGNGIDFLNNKKCDLLICNPPYIPRPQSIDDNPYEGLKLLEYLIKNFRQIINPNGKFITNLSSLSKKEMEEAIKRAGLKIKVLDKMTVPLKVMSVLNNKQWLKYLLAHGLKKQRKNGYDYYHTITIVEIG